MKVLKKINLSFMFIFVCVLSFISNVKAVTTDFSNVTYEITGITETSHTGAMLEISGVDFDWDNYGYLAYVTSSASEAPELITELVHDDVYMITSATTDFYIDKYLEKSGDIYVTLYEESTDGYIKATEPYKIDRPTSLALGSRIKAGFAYSGDTVTLFVPHGYNSERKVNYKIGQITDKNLLLSIKNGKSSSINDLLSYAKSASNGKTGTMATGLSDNTIIDNLGIVDNQYYYVYLELDNENGIYYDVEDVWIFQASILDDGKKFLLRYGDSGFSWNIEEDETSNTITTTVKNPATGINIGYGILVLIILISSIAYILIRKQSKFQKHN